MSVARQRSLKTESFVKDTCERMTKFEIEKARRDIDWEDCDRIKFLYGPFREKSVNPVSYDEKMKFWQETIEKYLEVKQTFRFNVKDMLKGKLSSFPLTHNFYKQ